MPYAMRATAELIGQVASLVIGPIDARGHEAYRARIDETHHQLIARVAVDHDPATLIDGAPNLLKGIDADGVAMHLDGRWHRAGEVPDDAGLEFLSDALAAALGAAGPGRPVVSTDALTTLIPQATSWSTVASGVLAVAGLSGRPPRPMFWFRGEQVQTFQWGGDPNDKPLRPGPNGPRLTPRASFAVWEEDVRGRSRPWLQVEIDAALRLRTVLLDVVAKRIDELARSNAELLRSNNELDAFAMLAGHDLKEPLRGIQKHARALLDAAACQDGSEARERLTMLEQLARRMDGLIDALLHYSRVGRVSTEHAPVELAQVVAEAVEMLGSRFDEDRVDFRVPRPMPAARGDRMRLREVFANLISNAVKYNDAEHPWVEVGYRDPGESGHDVALAAAPANVSGSQRVFYCRDNGIGIPSAQQERVFEIFRRLHGPQAYGGGSGAGLAITRKLVEQHGGRIWVASEVGRETSFFFTLSGATA